MLGTEAAVEKAYECIECGTWGLYYKKIPVGKVEDNYTVFLNENKVLVAYGNKPEVYCSYCLIKKG